MSNAGLGHALAGCFWAVVLLIGCASPPLPSSSVAHQLHALLPADVLLLGEQHDNPDHQRIQRDVVEALASRGQLSAVVIEMAERPHTTASLPSAASAADVQAALRWDAKAWPWSRYSPAVMAAVRAGVPVLGANLPRDKIREAMGQTSLDTRLDSVALAAQNQAIREGHCNLLPEKQIAPMTRIQIARDVAMAEAVSQATVVAPGKTVVLIAGSAHVDKALGIARHLPGGLNAKFVGLAATEKGNDSNATQTLAVKGFDVVWPTLVAPQTDYCAAFEAGRS